MRTNTLKSLSGVLALALMSTATSADNAQSNLDECRVLKEASDLCPSAQYKSNVKNVPDVNSRIQEHFENIPSTLDGLDVQCGHALQKALRLLEFPKYKGHSPEALPVCWSVRNSVSRACYDPFKYLCATSDHHRGDSEAALQAEIRDSLFMPLLNSRWASSPYIQEPDCVSFQDRDLKSMPGDNIKAIDDLEDSSLSQAEGREKEDNWLKEQSVAELNGDQGGLFDFLTDNDSLPQAKGYQQQMAEATLKAKHLSRRDRVKHHHHHHQHQQRHHHHEQKRSTEQISGAKEPQPQSEDHHPLQVADVVPGQTIYAVHQVEGSTGGAGGNELLHESLSHAETNKENGEQAKGQQRILIQGGSGPVDPAGATGSLGKASAGQSDPKNLTDATITESQDGTGSPHKDPLMLAAIPILLLMGAIVGFTVYRRFYENSQGGDVQDEYSSDGYHRRDLPIRKGSPIHFDRTFLNTIHSPPPTATYLNDPENSSCNGSPSSIASVTMKRPSPSAGSLGKMRRQELSRSYDFAAGFRSIKNALIRSNNSSRNSALDQTGSVSNNSLHGKSAEYAFGTGGHSITKIGSHPGLNALERQQLQQQYSSAASGSSRSRFPDMNSLTIPQERSIVWGQYSANDYGVHQDAASTIASNLARRSTSSNSLSLLSGGKYSHHHQQSSGHRPGTSTDSNGDYLSPESPSMTREKMMRCRDLYAESYTFGLEGDETHSGTDLLFDARNHFLDLGVEKIRDSALRDEEMDMYLSMEKEESPFVVDEYSFINSAPYEPKVLQRSVVAIEAIQKTTTINEKEPLPARCRLEREKDGKEEREEFNEKKAMQAVDEALTVTAPAVVEPEETHVLGSASPEWTAMDDGSSQGQAVEWVAATEAANQLEVALLNVNDNISLETAVPISSEAGAEPMEWEEDSEAAIKVSSSAAALIAAQQQSQSQGQGQNQGKKKGNKSKPKKGHKH